MTYVSNIIWIVMFSIYTDCISTHSCTFSCFYLCIVTDIVFLYPFIYYILLMSIRLPYVMLQDKWRQSYSSSFFVALRRAMWRGCELRCMFRPSCAMMFGSCACCSWHTAVLLFFWYRYIEPPVCTLSLIHI